MTEYERQSLELQKQSLELQRQSCLLLGHLANGIGALLTQPEAGGAGLSAAAAEEAHAGEVVAWQRKLRSTIDQINQPRAAGTPSHP